MPFLLPAKWRERADYLRRFGDPACARLWGELPILAPNYGGMTLSVE